MNTSSPMLTSVGIHRNMNTYANECRHTQEHEYIFMFLCMPTLVSINGCSATCTATSVKPQYSSSIRTESEKDGGARMDRIKRRRVIEKDDGRKGGGELSERWKRREKERKREAREV